MSIEFAGKLARITADGTIEMSRLINARTGELGWFPVANPTPALLKAFLAALSHPGASHADRSRLTMTPAIRFSAALRTLQWGPSSFARIVGVSERSVRYWLTGRYEVPAPVLEWTERLVLWLADNPPPHNER